VAGGGFLKDCCRFASKSYSSPVIGGDFQGHLRLFGAFGSLSLAGKKFYRSTVRWLLSCKSVGA
jgi:hypothetical protein